MTNNPADVQDIVERLRERINDSPMPAERLIDEASEEIERLRAALEFYASGVGHTEIDDNGATARAALSQESADAIQQE